MAHATTRGAYVALADRLNRFPQGAPPSDLLYRILGILLSEREAGLIARLPFFDDSALASHRAMAAILGVILRLQPMKQVMATEQMRSRYLVSILERVNL